MVGVALCIDTKRPAYTGSLSRRTGTLAGYTGLSTGAFDATVSTVIVVSLGIDTTATALFWCTCWAARDAERIGAQLASRAFFVTFATVVAIGFGIDAFVNR
jgi:hypothetical protein